MLLEALRYAGLATVKHASRHDTINLAIQGAILLAEAVMVSGLELRVDVPMLGSEPLAAAWHLNVQVPSSVTQAPPIRVALVDALDKDGARAIVVRRTGGRSVDLILVTEATTPSDLAIAIAVLLRHRASSPARERGEVRAYIPAVPVRESRGAAVAAAELSRLKRQLPEPLEGIGVVRSILWSDGSGAS
jgi:hypothetical protein